MGQFASFTVEGIVVGLNVRYRRVDISILGSKPLEVALFRAVLLGY